MRSALATCRPSAPSSGPTHSNVQPSPSPVTASSASDASVASIYCENVSSTQSVYARALSTCGFSVVRSPISSPVRTGGTAIHSVRASS